MKKSLLIPGLSALFVVAVISCSDQKAQAPVAEEALSQDSLISRGNYLVTVIGCSDCHSPKIMGPQGPMLDPDRMLSGHPSAQPLPPVDTTALKSWVLFNHSQTVAVGPWGVSFAANITGDSTGIGAWTEAQFFRAMKQGKYKGLEGSRTLLPPMPFENYANMKDVDLKAIFAYLKSTKPVNNVVPAAIPPGGAGK